MSHNQLKDAGSPTQWVVNDAAGLDAITDKGAVIVDATGAAWQLGTQSPYTPTLLMWHRAGGNGAVQSRYLDFPVTVLRMEATQGRAA